MKKVKRALGACAMVVLAAALSGCVVVPVPYGYGYGGYHHYRH